MIFFGRVPFIRPAAASANFVPRSFDARMYSDIDPMPQIMPPIAAGLPPGVRNPLEAEPAGGARAQMPIAPATVPVGGFGLPGGPSPLALAQRATMALPPWARRAVLASKIRSKLSASNIIARGRNPGK